MRRYALTTDGLRGRRGRGGACLVIALVSTLVVTLAALGGAWWLYQKEVVDAPEDEVSRESILRIIAQESPIYYSDGETQLGVFFAREHRVYVPYADIPQAWVQAIVSAEDQNFWDHKGIDPEGITRAMVRNVQAGGLVAGGSTLTQQTAKNIYYRPDRSLKSKLREASHALRLERHHSKEDILEFYANQFHVSGNGRGIGIAARYFFDKEVTELTLQESAFLAGLVKAPAWYNPFIGSTEERRAEARAKAQDRTTYVLRRMYEDGHISEAEYLSLKDTPLPFKQGTFRYSSSVMVDEVQRRLEQAPFPEVFAAAGIDNPSTAGIQVVTTLDEGAQRASTYALWHHLSEIGPLLEGADARDFLQPDARPAALARRPKPMTFHHATVTGEASGAVLLDLGGYEGRLTEDAIERGGLILTRAEKGDRWAKVSKAETQALRGALKPGAVVWVSVRPDAEGEVLDCDLELRPEVQGGLMVLEDGQIRAMVGGNDNRDFNRATAAKRQLGSTWKTLIYDAALQLNWTPTDLIDNRRGVFPFEGTWYYPRPDHQAPDFVSLSWSGVNSENLASIWLLYHLTDRLNAEQVRRLAELTGLAQGRGESEQAYIARIRDEHGVIATRDRIEAGLFYDVKEQVIADLAFTGRPEDALELRSMHYGMSFSAERRRQAGDAARLQALESDFVYLESQLEPCESQLEVLRAAMQPVEPDQLRVRTLASEIALISVREDADEERFDVACGRAPEGFAPASEVILPLLEGLDAELAELREEQAAAPTPGGDLMGAVEADDSPRSRILRSLLGMDDEPEEETAEVDLPSLPALGEDPLLYARVHASTLRATRAAVDARADQVKDLEPYDPELLYLHPDFRVMLGMQYVSGLARALGVQSELPPVLSMPLGAVEISLEEAAGVYQGLLTGQSWRFPGAYFEAGAVPGLRSRTEVGEIESPSLLIAKILDKDGNVLYRAEAEAEQVTDPVGGRLTASILRSVVRFGTGRRAASLPWPVGGKTGTTNAFRNAAFIGYAPVVEDGELDASRLMTVAAYVGYDDNRPLTRGRARLSGASAALPAWAGAIEQMGAMGLLGDPVPGQELPVDRDYVSLPVADKSGLPAEDVAEALQAGRLILVHGDAEHPIRRFAPFTEPAQESEGALEAPPEDPAPAEPPGDTDADIPGSIWDEIQ